MTRYGLSLVGVFAVGMVLGIVYFAILWQTVRRLPVASSPVKLLMTSLLIRVGIVLPAFYLIMAGRWERFWGQVKPHCLRNGAVHGHSGPE